MRLAPIVLFVFNRPDHTFRVLNDLKENEGAKESILYIFSDGPKDDSSPELVENINRVREVIRRKKWCGQVEIIESKVNLGLANSVINGVSSVFEKHDKIIVLEDDILTSPFFLSFMNKALDMYEGESDVFGVSGHNFKSDSKIKESTYFLPIMSSWGYGTWKDKWNLINFDGKVLLNTVLEKKMISSLDFADIKYYDMLINQVEGRNDSWAVRFYVSMFFEKGIFLYPNIPFIKNIGMDGTGVHCPLNEDLKMDNIELSLKSFDFLKIPVRIDNSIVSKFKHAHLSKKERMKKTIKKNVKKIIPSKIIELIRFSKNYSNLTKSKEEEIKKIIPRYTEFSTSFLGQIIKAPDNASFVFMKEEIFDQNIYQFKSSIDNPVIIDGGANIGLATIYFKKLFPKSRIIAFEPDNYIFTFLKYNVDVFNFENVELIRKGLWNKDDVLQFESEGADAGSIISDAKSNMTKIDVTSLRPFLNTRIDFLKLDIEGAETVVLQDIENLLYNVERIFVEYHSYAGKEQSLDVIVNILTKAGFRLQISSPGVISKKPFIEINTYNGMDMQLNIFGYRSEI